MERRDPSRWWYVGHVFCWVASGLACYVLYKGENPAMARRHLVASVWMPIVVWGVISAASVFLIPDGAVYHP